MPIGHDIETGLLEPTIYLVLLRNPSLKAEKLLLGSEGDESVRCPVLGDPNMTLLVLKLQLRIQLPYHLEQTVGHAELTFARTPSWLSAR
jgi:hypothetical protein